MRRRTERQRVQRMKSLAPRSKYYRFELLKIDPAIGRNEDRIKEIAKQLKI